MGFGVSLPCDTILDADRRATHYLGSMMILRAVLAPLVLVATLLPAQAEKISLGDLSAYLNGLTTVETEFTQVNADGSISTGKLIIKRPGRVRFEYAPPDESLVLASAGAVQAVAMLRG